MVERQRRSYHTHVVVCPMCDKSWLAAKSNAICCSARCRQRLARDRIKIKAAARAAAKKKKKIRRRKRAKV